MNSTSPAVSVIMPVRNGGPWLIAAVDSILHQTLADLELVIIDDHSSDGAIRQLPADARIRVFPVQGSGIVCALNTALDMARGRWIARMDADDIAMPERLRCQRDYLLANRAVHLVGAEVEWLEENAVAGGNRRYLNWLNRLQSPESIRREIYIESPLPHPTWFAERSFFQRLGGYRDLGWAEDYDLLLRADLMGLRMGKPAGTLLYWREHPDRLTRVDQRYSKQQFAAAKAHCLAHGRLAEAGENRPVLIWGAGPGGTLLHDALARESVGVDGFVEVHPRRIGGLKRNKPVVHFETLKEHADALILVAVGVPSARREIRDFLAGLERVEGEDYLFVT